MRQEIALKRWQEIGDPDRAAHKWHVAINRAVWKPGTERKTGLDFMYRAKELQDEVPRLVALFGRERRGELTQTHRQCSCSTAEPVTDNHLTCCLGTKCRECPHLAVIEATDMTDDHKDEAKAWTCAAHIMENYDQCDPSEGFVLTVDDQMFWDGVYRSLASGPPS